MSKRRQGYCHDPQCRTPDIRQDTYSKDELCRACYDQPRNKWRREVVAEANRTPRVTSPSVRRKFWGQMINLIGPAKDNGILSVEGYALIRSVIDYIFPDQLPERSFDEGTQTG